MTGKFHVKLSINMGIIAVNLLHVTYSESVNSDEPLPVFIKQSS